MRSNFDRKENGQVILWLAFGLPLLILFAAMAIDMGIVYRTKARLSNAVDAAVLGGAKNYSLGTTTAQALGTDLFVANFGSTVPTMTWAWCPDTSNPNCPSNSPISATLLARTTVNTTFMAYLPRFAQLSLGDTGQATRSNLVMTLILDRSGSMACGGSNDTCGGPSLQAAVPVFVGYFTEGVDTLGMVSFGDDAKVDVAATKNFTTPIKNAVSAFQWNGATFGTGAGTNSYDTAHGPPLNLADNQNNSVTFPTGQPYIKVAVYFTDGLMNTIQDTLPCTNALGSKLYNFGGYDAPSTQFDFFDPTIDTYQLGDLSYLYGNNNNNQGTGAGCPKTTQQTGYCNGYPPYNATYSCKGVRTFPSQQSGTAVAFSESAMVTEAQYRALYTAKQMGNESPVQTYLYVIGLGSLINNASTQLFLAKLANDNQACDSNGNNCKYGNNLDKTRPPGLFVPVTNCPSAGCTASLEQAFQQIAARIELRLSQ